MSESVIRIHNLSKVFAVSSGLFARNKAYVRALDQVELDVKAGEVVGLIGESGSGKTTLARVLLGLTGMTSGEAEINGKSIAHAKKKAMKDIRTDVAVVFQDPAANLNPRQTVEESIIRPLRLRGIGKAEARRMAEEALVKVKLDHTYLSAYPHQLSGGQQQRIAIARAIVMQPKIMILDEPTSALDISVQAQVLNLLLDLQEELHLTYLIITHDINVVRYVADKIAVMYMGRLVEYGSVDEILERPIHPYTINLEKYVPVLDPHKRSDRQKNAAADETKLSQIPDNSCVLAGSCPYATEQCRISRPEFREAAPGHMVACFRHVDK